MKTAAYKKQGQRDFFIQYNVVEAMCTNNGNINKN